MPSPKELSDMNYVAGTGRAGKEVRMINGGGHRLQRRCPQARQKPAGSGDEWTVLSVDGLPLIKPPYGTISAINLDTGEIVWQIAHGETPDLIRNHPALKGLRFHAPDKRAGTSARWSPRLWSSRGTAQVTTGPDHPRGAMLRAYDKKTGKEVGAIYMPAPAERLAHDLHAERQTVHRGCRQRRQLTPASTLPFALPDAE